MSFPELLTKVNGKIRAISKKLRRKTALFDSDDLYQEAITFLWETHKNGKWNDKNESYIVQGCYLFLKNYIRTAIKSIDKQAISLEGATANKSAEENPAPLEQLLKYESGIDCRDIAQAHIFISELEDLLDKRDRNIFILKTKGFTSREIGKRFGMSHVSVVKIQKRVQKTCEKYRKEIYPN